MQLVIEKAAIRRMKHLPRQQREDLLQRLRSIAADPFAHHANVKRLVGVVDGYRLRVGNWRAVYRLNRQSAIMTVMTFEPRGSAN